MTATKTEPTDDQIKAYADKLPEIYREVLAAFPAEAPDRRTGDGLTVDTIDAYLLVEARGNYRTDDLVAALDQLERRGFVKRVGGPEYGPVFCSPSPLGERLITAVTGHRAETRGIPPLPEPMWG